MGIRKRHVVLVAAIGGLLWLAFHRHDDGATDDAGARDAATSSAQRSVAEFIAALPTPASIKLRPIYIDVGDQRLEGQAIDEAEHPIGGATITLNGTRTTTTEADGSFAFDKLAAAEYRVVAEKGPLYAEDTVSVYDGADPTSLELKPGTTLVVHVLADRGPVGDANVHCDSREGVTDRTGTVKFRGVDLSSANVEIKAAGFGSLRASVETGDNPMATIEKTFTLKPGASVGGLVVDQDGKPVADANVSIHAAAGTWRDSVDTDATGHWKVDGIGAGRFAATASSRIHIEMPDLVVMHDGVHDKTDVVVHVQLGLELTGDVVDEAGKPVVGANVSASGGYGSSDDHGHFDIKGLTPGEIELSASTDTKGSEIRKLVLARGSRPSAQHIVVVESDIAGIVKNGKGEPVADVTIWAREIHDKGNGYGRTDEFGKFDLGGIPPGEYELVPTHKRDHQDMPKHGVLARTGDRHVALVIADLGTIVGRVMLDGAPVEYFGVVITDDPEGASFSSPDTVRAPDGAFTEADLRPGSLGIVLVGPNFMKKIIKRVAVNEGVTTDLGDIVVDRGRSVTGRVTDSRGLPVAGAVVSVSGARGIEDETTLRPLVSDTRTAKSDANGNYRIDGIEPDAKDLNIAASDDHGIAMPRTLDAGATILDLVIAHTGSIDGVVSDPHGRSSIYARTSDGLSFYARVDNSGEFHIDRLPPGAYTIELHGHVTIAPRLVTVSADATTSVTFEIPATLIALGLHYAGCKRMTLETLGDNTVWLDSSECTNDGAVFENVAPGTYHACADFSTCSDITVAPAPQRQDFAITAASSAAE